jgi:hypothetical protein
VYGERERDRPRGVGGCDPRGDLADHQPLNRFEIEGLSGAADESLATSMSSLATPFLFLRVNVKPRGKVMGEPGREIPADDDDSDPDIGYVASSREPFLLVRFNTVCRSSSESALGMSPSRTPRGRYWRRPCWIICADLRVSCGLDVVAWDRTGCTESRR